jgi:hypothetical protein
MKFLNLVLAVLFLSLSISYAQNSNSPDNNLVKYYSALLTLNLNHAKDEARVLYHLSMESSFDKDILENEVERIHQRIEDANADIANMVENLMDSKKKDIDQSLKNIDECLAQVMVDLDQIKHKLNNDENVSALLSDIYFQINKAGNKDHQEIRETLGLKSSEESLLVIPEKIR